MNFDDEEDSDFNFSTQSGNKLASLFKSNAEPATSDNLKYKPTKQPQAQNPSNTTTSQQASSSVLFFSSVLAYKYLNGRYESQAQNSKLGLAIINSQNTYRILIYLNKTQPLANIKLTLDFKLAIQKNNYTSFYDESSQLWSVLFDNEELVASFGTNIALGKCNLLQGNLADSYKLYQDLKTADSDLVLEPGDSIELSGLLTIWKDMKLQDVVENTQQKPVKLRLGKNKLPQYIEDSIIDMKQGDRRLFVIKGAHLQPQYPNLVNSIVFYDINILRIKKNTKERSSSNATNDSIPLPQVNLTSNQFDSEQESRSRSDSVRDKSKTISEQLLDPKSDKAKLISRMAKMGQQTLPIANNPSLNIIENEEDWDVNSKLATPNILQENAALAAAAKASANAASILLQQQKQVQQLQQQMNLQNQLYQATSTVVQNPILTQPTNQLALYTSPNSQILAYPQSAQTPIQFDNQQQFVNQQKPTISDPESTSKILTKLELITEKIDQVKTITQINNQNMPNMETSILLQNIQRIVRENEQYKKDLYEKSNKIEEQNVKITELLMKAQTYVEQSHLILEQKNSSFQSTAEKNVNKVLELEQDKMKLTSELSILTSKISELNLEINKFQKADMEMRQQLSEVSKNMDQYKQNSDRLLIENADLQTKLDTCLAELKKERQLRKSFETKLQLNEEELTELRAGSSTSQKLIEERKRRLEQEKESHEKEVEELKQTHLNEINSLKEKIAKLKSESSESKSEQIKQIESDLNIEWSEKLEKSIQQCEQKHQRQLEQLNEEKENLIKQLDESKDLSKSLRLNLSSSDADKDKLKQELDEIQIYKEKYERLQSQALVMKERYETRIRELLEAEPDAEIIGEEVKKTMNAIYRKLKSQIKPDQFYGGNGILTAMLKIIKMVTLQILHNDQEGENEDKEEMDYFSEHIYKAVTAQAETKPIKLENKEAINVDVDENNLKIEPEPESESTNTQSDDKETQQEIRVEVVKKQEEEEEDDDIQLIEDEGDDQNREEPTSGRLRTNSNVEYDEKTDTINSNQQQTDLDDDSSTNINDSNLQQALEKSEEKQNEEEQQQQKVEDDKNEDEDDDHEGEFDVYEKETSQKMNASESIKKTTSLFDDDEEDEEDLFSGANINKKQEESDGLKLLNDNNQTTRSDTKKASLFDDVEEEEDDELFTFKSASKNKEATIEKSDLQTTIENNNNSNNNENLNVDEPSTTSSSSSNNKEPTTTATTTTTIQQVNLKFSPPPLFDNNEDDDNSGEIDWFK